MAGEWPIVTIESIADRVAMGPFGSSIKVETFVPTGVPVINGQHLQGFSVNDEIGFNFISEEHADRLKKANVQRGDIVFTHRGNIGQVALIPDNSKYERYVISQSQLYMRCDRSKVLPEFIVAYFKSFGGRHRLLANTSSVGVPSIAQPVTYLRTIEIPLPTLSEQRAIAHILGTLDDKIELNRRMNETLEAMARALFKSWFVDFDPVRARAEGRDPGLPKPLADLFPDSFEDSELGEIPIGWKVATLSDYATLNPESWKRETKPEMIEYVDLSNTKWGRIDAVARYSKGSAPSRAQRVLRPLDTIVGTVRPGNGAYAIILAEGLTGSTGFAVLRPDKCEHAEFVFLAASAPENIDRLAHLADGGAYPAVRPEVVAATQVVNSDAMVMKAFAGNAGSMLLKIAANEAETFTLAALRDALLPRLISGELRVSIIERVLEG